MYIDPWVVTNGLDVWSRMLERRDLEYGSWYYSYLFSYFFVILCSSDLLLSDKLPQS